MQSRHVCWCVMAAPLQRFFPSLLPRESWRISATSCVNSCWYFFFPLSLGFQIIKMWVITLILFFLTHMKHDQKFSKECKILYKSQFISLQKTIYTISLFSLETLNAICDGCKIGTYKLEHFPPYPRPQCNPSLKHAENYAQFQHK